MRGQESDIRVCHPKRVLSLSDNLFLKRNPLGGHDAFFLKENFCWLVLSLPLAISGQGCVMYAVTLSGMMCCYRGIVWSRLYTNLFVIERRSVFPPLSIFLSHCTTLTCLLACLCTRPTHTRLFFAISRFQKLICFV